MKMKNVPEENFYAFVIVGIGLQKWYFWIQKVFENSVTKFETSPRHCDFLMKIILSFSPRYLDKKFNLLVEKFFLINLNILLDVFPTFRQENCAWFYSRFPRSFPVRNQRNFSPQISTENRSEGSWKRLSLMWLIYLSKDCFEFYFWGKWFNAEGIFQHLVKKNERNRSEFFRWLFELQSLE